MWDRQVGSWLKGEAGEGTCMGAMEKTCACRVLFDDRSNRLVFVPAGKGCWHAVCRLCLERSELQSAKDFSF